jgi:hypothetical protein
LAVSEERLSDLRSKGDIIYEGLETGLFGQSWSIALSIDEINSCSPTEKFAVLQGPPEFLDALST